MVDTDERPFKGLDSSFVTTAKETKCNIRNFVRSGQYYVTPEMTGELRHLIDGVDHIKLDHEFLQSSKPWGEEWDPDLTRSEMHG